MHYVAYILGSLTILVGIVATEYVSRVFARHQMSAPWKLARIIFMLIGLAAGVYCVGFFVMTVSPTERLQGFPVPIALYHLKDGVWRGAGAGSIWILGDFLFGYLLTQIPFSWRVYQHERTRLTPTKTVEPTG